MKSRKSIGWLKKNVLLKVSWGLRLDLHTFNLALLVKQRWRILQNETSLLHRVYKARYFPSTSFFGVKVGYKSLLCVLENLGDKKVDVQKVCRCRIEDEKSARLWKDPWLYSADLVLTSLEALGFDPHRDTMRMFIESQTKS